jgi:hypothetical protein
MPQAHPGANRRRGTWSKAIAARADKLVWYPGPKLRRRGAVPQRPRPAAPRGPADLSQTGLITALPPRPARARLQAHVISSRESVRDGAAGVDPDQCRRGRLGTGDRTETAICAIEHGDAHANRQGSRHDDRRDSPGCRVHRARSKGKRHASPLPARGAGPAASFRRPDNQLARDRFPARRTARLCQAQGAGASGTAVGQAAAALPRPAAPERSFRNDLV